MTAERTCSLSPFLSPVVAQVRSLEDAGSALEILTQTLENYLAAFKSAICDDLTQIVEECCGTTPPDDISFLDLTDTPSSYVGAAGLAVAVNVGETGLEFVPFPTAEDELPKWINYSFGLVAGTPLQTVGNGGGGSSPTASTTIPALATTSVSASIYKVQYVTNGGTNQICWVILSALLVAIGTSTSIGGFRWRARGGPNSAVTNQRCFFGLRGVTTNPTSVDPSGQTNIIGFGQDSGDSNLSVMHNDNAGAATEIPLGANFPVAAGELYDFELTCVPGAGTVDYSITRLNTGDVATGTISTNLPATNQFLCGILWAASAGTAGVVSLWFVNQYHARY